MEGFAGGSGGSEPGGTPMGMDTPSRAPSSPRDQTTPGFRDHPTPRKRKRAGNPARQITPGSTIGTPDAPNLHPYQESAPEASNRAAGDGTASAGLRRRHS